MLFYVFITCVVMAGAFDIQAITGAVDIANSAFSDNEAQLGGGRILSLDNDNENDNDTCIYMCTHCENYRLMALISHLSLSHDV